MPVVGCRRQLGGSCWAEPGTTLTGDPPPDHPEYGRIIAERAKLGESKIPGRERYRRSLKGCVWVGDTAGIMAPSGLRLDIAPDAVEWRPAFELRGLQSLPVVF